METTANVSGSSREFGYHETLKRGFDAFDPRIPVAAILFAYLLLGLTVLGFTRDPLQVVMTTVSCCALEVLLTRLFKKQWIFPMSAMITSFSLSFLLNYGHDHFLLFVPLFFAIGSKYVLNFNGKHALNPAMMGVSLSLLFAEDLVTASPAYQWTGIASMSIFILMLGLIFVIPKVNRQVLVLTFLITYTIQTFLRAMIMRHHLPFETLFLGTLTSPSFLIFTFFMITDPATSPNDRKQQIIVGFSLATVDLLLHLRQSYYTFFYAALIVGAWRLTWNHLKGMRRDGIATYLRSRFVESGYYWRPLTLGLIAITAIGLYKGVIRPTLPAQNTAFQFEVVPASVSGLDAAEQGDVYAKLDPRVQHIAKWVLSVGDSVATGDFDNDGDQDLFLTNVLKTPSQRAMLYRYDGENRFTKVAIPALQAFREDPKANGLVSNAVFIDYDNDGDQDLYATVGFGESRMLKNMLSETGKPDFKDVTKEIGLEHYTNSLSATFGDFDRDGLLDLFVLNVWPEYLPNYETPRRLNIFDLPKEEFEGDDRPYDFMHASWHQANNGGVNLFYHQTADHRFVLEDAQKIGMPETRWSLAAAAADYNHDGWPDLYVANDFGPDDLYFNNGDGTFENVKGTIFGSIGRDTYKGMNATAADFDRTGWLQVYVSNVHHAFQAEGSLLWSFKPGDDPKHPVIEEIASRRGALNEQRFGWGAVAADFDNDGWIDLAQANGMVDDKYDKVSEKCGDYWYVNEKVARSAPSFHRLANKWGDVRGMCIYGKEANRMYLNRGPNKYPQYVDVAEEVGMTELTNSRGMAAVDFDNDGSRDLVVTHEFEAPTFYKNKLKPEGQKHKWIGLVLESQDSRCNREAIGTRVTLSVQPTSGKAWNVTGESQAVSGFSAQSDKRLHFGLGSDVKNVSARISWCGQFNEEVASLDMNKYNSLVFKGKVTP